MKPAGPSIVVASICTTVVIRIAIFPARAAGETSACSSEGATCFLHDPASPAPLGVRADVVQYSQRTASAGTIVASARPRKRKPSRSDGAYSTASSGNAAIAATGFARNASASRAVQPNHRAFSSAAGGAGGACSHALPANSAQVRKNAIVPSGVIVRP